MSTDTGELVKFLQQYSELEPEVILDNLENAAYSEMKSKFNNFKSLEKEALSCTKCPLSENRKNVVFGTGNINTRLMFIGEGPGADEDRQGKPFVGRAGQLLNRILKAMELERSEVYIANVVKCRPPANRDPERHEAETCMPYLKKQIEIIDPDVLVALGRIAAVYLLNLNPNTPLKAVRERIQNYKNKPLIVTYHPAAMLRFSKYKAPTWEDMQKAMKLLSGELKWEPEKSVFETG